MPAAFFIGTLAAADFLQVGFVTGLLAIVVGNVVGSVLVGILGQMGPATGMAQMPLSRLAYGKSIVVPGLLNWISCIGWDGINNIFGAAAISLLTGLPFVVSLLFVVAAQALLGVIGYEAIHTFEKYMAIVLGAMFAVLTVAILGEREQRHRPGGRVHRPRPAGRLRPPEHDLRELRPRLGPLRLRLLPVPAGERVAFPDLLVDGPRPDSVGRLDRNARPARGRQVDGPRPWARSTTSWAGRLFGALAMIAIAIGTVAVNAMNDYTGSLSLQAAGVRVPRVYAAIIVAILGFLFTLYLNDGDLVGKFESYLLFISYWVTPWAAVVVADWWLRGRRADVSHLTDFARLPSGVLALLSLVLGFVISLPFQTSVVGGDIGTATGLPINTIAANNLHYADFAYLVGFVVAGGIYWIGTRMGWGKQAA